MNIKEKSLTSVLAWCDLKDLPPKDDGVNIWIKAVILVTKTDCKQNYAYAVKDDNGSLRIVRDFGESSPIFKIEEVYPYEFLNEGYVPVFKKNTKDERIAWLKRYGVNATSESTLKELDRMVINQAIKNNLNALKNG